MNTTRKSKPRLRALLVVLLFFLALNAFGGGWYGMAGAEKVPLEWLSGSPFKTYFLPALYLFVVIGGLALTAGIAVWRKAPAAGSLTMVCSVLLFLWIAAQVLIIGFVSWLQPFFAGYAILLFLLSRNMRPHAA